MYCVNTSSLEFKKLHLAVGGNIVTLAADVSLWQEKNGFDKFPTKEDILKSNNNDNFNLNSILNNKPDLLLEELLKKTKGVKIVINNSIKQTTYNAWSGEILINPDLIKEGKELEVIKHELIHALTVGQYYENSEFRNRLKKVYDLAKSKLFDKYKPYFSNDLEFLAYATTNAEFMNDLNKINIKSNDKKTTLKTYLLNIIKKALGLIIEKNSLLEEIMNIYETYATEVLLTKDEKTFNYTDLENNKAKEIIDKSIKESAKYTLYDEESDYYMHNEEKSYKYNRVTNMKVGLLGMFDGLRLTKEEKIQKAADNIFKGKLETDKVEIKGEFYTKKEFINKSTDNLLKGAKRGILTESLFNIALSKLQNTKYEISERETNIMIEENVDLNDNFFNKLLDNGKTILEQILYNYKINIRKDKSSDVALLQQTVGVNLKGKDNKTFTFAGTEDLKIVHPDGTISIFDIKSNVLIDKQLRGINDYLKTHMLAHGKQLTNLTNDPLTMAKLQVLLYAVIEKINNPDIKFKNLSIMNLHKESALRSFKEGVIDVDNMLPMIEQAFKDKKFLKDNDLPEDLYELLITKSKNVFKSSEYRFRPITYKDNKGNDKSINLEEEMEHRINEIKKLQHEIDLDKKIGKKTDYSIIKLLKNKTKELLEISNIFDYDLNILTSPMGIFEKYTIGLTRVRLPYVKLFMNIYEKYKLETVRAVNSLVGNESLFNKLNKDLVEEWGKRTSKIKNIALDLKLKNVVYYSEIEEGLYNFAIVKFEKNGQTHERLKIGNEIDEYDNKLERHLTDTEKKWLKEANRLSKHYFDTYFNKTAVEGVDFYGQKKTFTVLELDAKLKDLDSTFEYYEGWFPKVIITEDELKYHYGNGNTFTGLFTKDFIKAELQSIVTKYADEENVNIRKYNMLPIKGLGNSPMLYEGNPTYSKNLEYVFSKYVSNIEHKKQGDKWYSLSKGLLQLIAAEKNIEGDRLYKHEYDLVKAITDSWATGLTSNEIEGLNMFSDKNAGRQDTFGMKYIDKLSSATVNIYAILNSALGISAKVKLGLKPIQGIGNGIASSFLLVKESTKSSKYIQKMIGIKDFDNDFTITDILDALSEYNSFIKDRATGNLANNKLYKLSKYLNYMPTGFDYKLTTEDLQALRNSMLTTNTLTIFYSLPEEFISLMTMTAQLKRMKLTNSDKTIWDSYDVVKENNVTKIKWNGGTRFKVRNGNIETNITELTPKEVLKLKEMYSQIYGNYQHEDLLYLGTNIFGKHFLFLKRYIAMMLNKLVSGKTKTNLGEFVMTNEHDIEGIPYAEWYEKEVEGLIPTLLSLLVNVLKYKSLEESLANMTNEQKRNLIDIMVTAGFGMMIAMLFSIVFWDDDDDNFDNVFRILDPKTPIQKFVKRYLFDNTTQIINMGELFRTLKGVPMPTTVDWAYNAQQGLIDSTISFFGFLFGEEELTNDGLLKGNAKLFRNIPGLSGLYDVWKFSKDSDIFNEKYK